MKTAVRDQVNRMDAKEYFTLLAQLMKTNPPSAADAPALAKFSKIGLVPGKDFDASKLNADFVKHIPQFGFDRIMTPGAEKETNWLPAPAGKFILMLRMYWPTESDPSILDGTWTIPAVKKVA
jgi:hypothetical protein